MPTAPDPSFGNPPVSEVVCCIYFQELGALQVAHVGRLWDRLRHRYTSTQTVSPLPSVVADDSMPEATIQFQIGAVDAGFFPRIWFVSEGGEFLVQVQRDRLIVNWRQLEDHQTAYPSFGSVRDRFAEAFNAFVSFLEAEGLGRLDLIGQELIYVNTFPWGREMDGAHDIEAVMPGLRWREALTGASGKQLVGLNWNAQIALPEGSGDLHISLATIHRRTDGKGATRLTFVARKFYPSLATESMWGWFDRAHETIVATFLDVTSANVQNGIWERHR